MCNLLVAGPGLISHLLAPISQSVTLPATWNVQLHLGLLKKARQPKWRRCSQWRLTCPVACCKIRGWKRRGDITLLSFPPAQLHMLLPQRHHHHTACLAAACDKSAYLRKLAFPYLGDSLLSPTSSPGPALTTAGGQKNFICSSAV